MKQKRRAKTISVTQLLRRFSTEERCIAWLERAKWNNIPVCPYCGGTENISRPKSKPFTYWHRDCRKQFTMKNGSVMHASKTPTQNWIVAIYSVLTARKGVSAMQLSKEVGVQYRTAWYMLHRIREACAKGEFMLSDVVEVDETYIGGKERNRHESKKLKSGRGTVGKTPVIGARELDGKVVAKPIQKADKITTTDFVESCTERGSTVYTDDASAYSALLNRYDHETVNHSAKELVWGEVHTNSIENVGALFKRSMHGTWHHVSEKHLNRYVNEDAFRLNDGNCEVDTIDRMRSLAQQSGGKRLPYKELVA